MSLIEHTFYETKPLEIFILCVGREAMENFNTTLGTGFSWESVRTKINNERKKFEAKKKKRLEDLGLL